MLNGVIKRNTFEQKSQMHLWSEAVIWCCTLVADLNTKSSPLLAHIPLHLC